MSPDEIARLNASTARLAQLTRAVRSATEKRAPLRWVVDIVTETKWSPSTGSYSVDYELLECGHKRTPKPNTHFGGTDLGNAKRRRCHVCADVGEKP